MLSLVLLACCTHHIAHRNAAYRAVGGCGSRPTFDPFQSSKNWVRLSFFLPQVKELSESVLRDPIFLTVGTQNAGAADIDQRLVYVGREEGKLLAIRQLVQEGLRPPVLVFLQSKDRAKVRHARSSPHRNDEPAETGSLASPNVMPCVPNSLHVHLQALFHELVYDGINTDVMHASRTQVWFTTLSVSRLKLVVL